MMQYIIFSKMVHNVRGSINQWKLQYKKRFMAKVICGGLKVLWKRKLANRGGNTDVINRRNL